jgi:hypothetical protein
MEESRPLERPAEIYRPFTDPEREVLSEFVENVRNLGKMSFFEQVPKSASITYDESGTRSEMEEPNDEAVRAAITAFRQIYTKTEPTSAAVALNILERSIRARKGAQQAHARAAIKELRHWLTEIVDRGIGLGIVFERPGGSDPVPPLKILDTYFHGRYLHSRKCEIQAGARAGPTGTMESLHPFQRHVEADTGLLGDR